MDITTTLSAFVELGARWVLWMLVGLSIAGVAIILERVFFFVATRENPSVLRSEAAELMTRAGRQAVLRWLDEKSSSEARLTRALLSEGENLKPSAFGGHAMERLTAARALERLRLERGVSFLGTLAAAAPFVGLLGTVIGIVAAFHQLALSQGRLTGALMSEIGEALVATAVGLLVALPSLAAFNMLQRLIQVRLTRSEALAREILLHMCARAPAVSDGGN